MKKKILILLLILFIVLLAAVTWAIYTSFTLVKPITETIDENLEKTFAKIVRIPQQIPPPSRDFSQNSYLWEMETLDKEVIEVRFSYTPSYESRGKEIIAVLEMTEKGDPSIFDKVLPAIVADNQSLDSARESQKANFAPNPKSGYSKLAITKDSRNDKTIKITWSYKKEDLEDELKSQYQKLSKLPEPLLRTFYSVPSFLVSLVKG